MRIHYLQPGAPDIPVGCHAAGRDGLLQCELELGFVAPYIFQKIVAGGVFTETKRENSEARRKFPKIARARPGGQRAVGSRLGAWGRLVALFRPTLDQLLVGALETGLELL